MHFTASAAAFLALISHVVAQTDGFDAFSKPTSGDVLTAGSTFEVTWAYEAKYDGTVTITLLEGETASTLDLGDTVASGIQNSAGSYTWAVGSDLGAAATYGLKIAMDSDPSTFQYSFPFKIKAASSGSSGFTSSSAAAAAATTPASSSAPSSPAVAEIPSSSSAAAAAETPAALETETATSKPVITEKSETTVVASTATVVSKPASTGATQTTMTSVVSAASSSTGAASTGSGTSSSPSAVVTAGAGRVMGGSFVAVLGGLVAALFVM